MNISEEELLVQSVEVQAQLGWKDICSLQIGTNARGSILVRVK